MRLSFIHLLLNNRIEFCKAVLRYIVYVIVV